MKQGKILKVNAPENLPVDLNEFFGHETIEKAAELYERLQKPLINGMETGINLRNLNNWVNVLDPPKNSNRKKYTLTDFIWYKIVEQLREAGLSLTIISNFKTNLLEPIEIKGLVTMLQQAKSFIDELKLPKEQKQQLLQFLNSPESKNIPEKINFNLLHIIIIESVVKRLPLSLAVFLDGSFIPLDKTKENIYDEADKNKLLFETHVVVSVSNILKKFLLSDLAGFIVPEIGLFSKAENKLFELVHNGEYESITIRFKDKKIKSLELKKSENIKERIIDILNKGAFAEMIVKKHKGEIVKIENTIKVTL